ncbi:hypothetical protein EDF38_1540 [Frigoribacterium sp. PhB160]|uniref:hypothetical protein n=1 Tax=Frigoribacterium sp. PhB160 TaxID=2485192 RepID=UPI000F46AFD1|nr:hypothetical protein [Frigoribacterium sp. PhB160]ROS62429.1 hypothetical protein EDF38_1540 [Frigoribacterium sp. PhB160]
MLDRADDTRWIVRAAPDAPAEAVVEAFGSGFRLESWALDADERETLGVHTSPDQAETAWWRHLDRDRGQRTETGDADTARRLGEA